MPVITQRDKLFSVWVFTLRTSNNIFLVSIREEVGFTCTCGEEPYCDHINLVQRHIAKNPIS